MFRRALPAISLGAGECGICVTLLTSLLWIRNVRSCGSG